MERWSGYIHSQNSIDIAFMHRSSEPAFEIPYYNPLFGVMPNSFVFLVTSQVVSDFGTDCSTTLNQNEDRSSDCIMNYTENALGCQLIFGDIESGEKYKA